MSRRAWVGLGSNLGSCRDNLEEAVRRLAGADVQVARASSVYLSAPVGPVQEQPAFYNAVIELATPLSPRQLLGRCLGVEQAMGRERVVPQGPRLIDLDLLLVEGVVGDWPELTLPHPELTRRAFATVPLVEIAPMAVDPRDGTLLCAHVGRLLHGQPLVRVGTLRPLVEAEPWAAPPRPEQDEADAGR